MFLNLNITTNLEVLTRSSLIIRDSALLRSLKATIGISISVLPNKLRTLIEPFSSAPEVRINLLKTLQEDGLNVYAFIAPVWPGEIKQLKAIINKLLHYNIKVQYIELLNKIGQKQFNVQFQQQEIGELSDLTDRLKIKFIMHMSI